MDAGEPIVGAYFLGPRDRGLPIPSPSANLAGVWKGNGQRLRPRVAVGFLFSLRFAPVIWTMSVNRHYEMIYTLTGSHPLVRGHYFNGVKVNKLSIAVIVLGVIIFLGLGKEVSAVSPQPYEIEKELERKAVEKVKPGEGDIVCTVVIKYISDPKTGRHVREDYSLPVVVRHTANKKDAVEEAVALIEDKLNDESISEVAIDCRFPKKN
jgi:hypothetical protein